MVLIPQILVLNVGIKNKGNEALVSSAKIILKEYVDSCQFINMGAEGTIQNNILPQPAKNPLKSPNPTLYLFECAGIRVLRQLGFSVHIPEKSKLRAFDEVDIVVNSGGDSLSGEKFVGSSFLNIVYALLLDKPVVLFGESLGYYRNPINRIVGKYIFNKVGLILVREELSKEYLLSIGIDERKIFVTSDPAFILPPAQRSRVDEILSAEDIPPFSTPIIGINPSGSITKYMTAGDTSDTSYIQTMADVIDHLIATTGFSILMIPHVYSPGGDDRETIKKIVSLVSRPEKVFQITEEYSAEDLKGIIGLCDIFVGARMHATIAATSLCIPTVGIAYGHKMHGIIGKTLNLERFIIDIADLNPTSLIAAIEAAWQERDVIRAHLEDVVPSVKKTAYLNGYHVAKFLESTDLIS